MRNLTAQELAALEIIRRGDEAVTGIQGTFNGEDAIFIVQVSAVEGSDEMRIYPLAMLLRDEDMPFVGGPHDEYPVGPERAAWPDQTEAAEPEAWPDEAVVSEPAAGWPDEAVLPEEAVLPRDDVPPPEGGCRRSATSMSTLAPGADGPPPSPLRGTARSAGPAVQFGSATAGRSDGPAR